MFFVCLFVCLFVSPPSQTASMLKPLEESTYRCLISFRSSDFGTLYTKLNLQPGIATVIDNFYICPTNKKKIILVSSSHNDRDQSLFISTDEGATFQKQPITFFVETLLFHPKEEDKVLAYTKEGKVYASIDLGKKWTLLQERHFPYMNNILYCLLPFTSKALSYVSVSLPSGYRYITCQMQNCSDKTMTVQFAGSTDRDSLTVQDDYIFLQTTSANRTKYYVSYRRNGFVQMKLPKYALPKDLQIISTDENQVFVAVQEWYQTDTYNLYQSDPQGVYYSILLENVRSTKQPEENVLIDILEVRGVKGVFLANQKIDGKVTTLITYNKGRDWDFLNPPDIDMNGKPTNCKPPDCYLHLHLRWADNPYVSGTVHTKDTAPGLIMGAGNLGSQLVEYKEEMYITSDCGNTVFEEEHHILYLDHGGVIVAIKDTSIPLKILKFSIDEGQTWSTHNFTSTSVFVDGLLSEPGDETLVMTVFGHISYRSDWELVKVDFRPSFPRECTDDDYESWDLTNLQGDRCIMGQQRSFRKRKISSWCIKGRSFTSALTSKVCECTSSDFLCDYGFERSAPLKSQSSKCFADFWFNPEAPPEDCVLGQAYTSSTGYRKVVSNVCEGGIDLQQNLAQHMCPLIAPKGLQISIRGESLAVKPGEDITFIVRQEQGDILNTKYQVDLGDGFKAIYVNLTMTGEPIRHRYENPGIYRVLVKAENVAGHDEAVVFIQVNRKLHFYFYFYSSAYKPCDNYEVIYTYRCINMYIYEYINIKIYTKCFLKSIFNGLKTFLFVFLDHFHVLPLKFTKHLDMYNPDIPEWREDIGRVVTRLLAKVLFQIALVKPGLPTTADLHVLLPANQPKRKRSVTSDKVTRAMYVCLLELCSGASMCVAQRTSITKLFLLVQFRKLPGRNVYAQMHNEKEQEMTSPVNHSEDTQNIIQGEEFIDDDLDSQTLGNARGNFIFSL
uniref:VPS10 domain-containing receptor SorCS2 n=1 Tax=Anas platyrhynchos TaxID=8839 RepID=A0A8B9SYS9_ANAPL